jgi:hypothetical protein
VQHRPLVLLALAAASLAAAGCFTTSGASKHALPSVKVQASSDLDCPQEQLRVVQGLGGRFEAVGCGQKKQYNTACDGLRCVVAPEGQSLPWKARPDPSDPTNPFPP